MSSAATTHDERDSDLLHRLEDALELPMIVLGLVWLALAAAELATVLPPWLDHVTTGIWAVFVADFVLRLWLARDRGGYLRQNWLTLVALGVPALRIFRIARVLRVLRATRAVRGLRLARMVTTFGRAKHSIHRLLARRHALGYVIALTITVAVLGAAGLLAFEQGTTAAFDGYGHALWWTAMLLTTMGSETWPQTVEGRALCLVLAIYGFAVFGYITATIASWLVGRDKAASDQPTKISSTPEGSTT